MNLLPEGRKCKSLYLQYCKNFKPNNWFCDAPVGENHMHSFVKDLTTKAWIPGYYTNHSLCATGCTHMYNDDIDKQVIQEISGQRSLAVMSYKRTCNKQCENAAKSIFGECH